MRMQKSAPQMTTAQKDNHKSRLLNSEAGFFVFEDRKNIKLSAGPGDFQVRGRLLIHSSDRLSCLDKWASLSRWMQSLFNRGGSKGHRKWLWAY